MSFTLTTTTNLEGNASFKNEKGNHECVVFVQGATGATNTASWKKGINVMNAPLGTIPTGTAIATFDSTGKYPTEPGKRHAAVYISHGKDGIRVYDQWNSQGMVFTNYQQIERKQTLYWNNDEAYIMTSVFLIASYNDLSGKLIFL